MVFSIYAERHGSTKFAAPFSYESPIGTQLPPNINYKVEMPQVIPAIYVLLEIIILLLLFNFCNGNSILFLI